MKNIILFYLLFPLLLLAQQKSVLFIGNSYTANLPSLTNQLATSLGDILIVGSNTPGGYTLQGHSTNVTTLGQISLGTWDYVVLQDQSQRPSFPPAQVANDVYPYAEELVSKIRQANQCAEPLFYMTWGRENGDQQNCSSYPPLCTYDGMQERLRSSYTEMGDSNQASVSPVGVAWKYTRDNYPAIDLYANDGSHPSMEGSYLAACVFYASIYKKSPEGASFISNISQTTAATLQEVAKLIVIDSLDTWRIGANEVSIDSIIMNPSVSSCEIIDFSAVTNGINFSWFFQYGDENSYDANGSYNSTIDDYGATASIQHPSIYFSSDGSKIVKLIASNGCTSDTLITTINLDCFNSIAENELDYNLKRDNEKVYLEFINQRSRNIVFYDLNGKKIIEKQTGDKIVSFDLNLLPKITLITIEGGENNSTTLKFIK